MSKDDRTPEAPEVNNEPKPMEEPKPADPAPAEPKPAEEPKLQDFQADPEPKPNEVPENIPYDRFKEVNDKSKEKDAIIADLTQKLADKNATPEEVREDLKEIAEQHNLDPVVLGQITKAIEAKALAKVDEAVKPITERERQAQADATFERMYAEVIEANPEYKDIANKDVIKQLAFNPANADLTLSQLLGKTYGGSVKAPEPSPTMEKDPTPRGGSDKVEKLDFARAQTDSEYFKQVMADPKLKKEYNKQNTEAVSQYI